MLLELDDAAEFLEGYKVLIGAFSGDEPANLQSWVKARDKMLEAVGEGSCSEEFKAFPEWKERIAKAVSGKFVFLKRYKQYCVMQNMEDETYFAVRSLTTPLEEMIPEFSVVEACLVPFNGAIVCDGLVVANNIYLGKNLVKEVRDGYWKARRSNALIEA